MATQLPSKPEPRPLERFNEKRSKERLRQRVVLLLVIFWIIMNMATFYVIAFSDAGEQKRTMLLQLLSNVTAAVMFVLGYYFGTQNTK